MNLVVDLGNTFFKFAVFDDKELLESHEFSHADLNEAVSFVSKNDYKATIISSVVNIPTKLISLLNKKSDKLIALNHLTPLPIKIKYLTKETLGNDRIALAVAAYSKYPNCNVLIIDAGSCITYDFVDCHGNYFGGGISPGINMRFKSLNTFTAKLPLVEFSGNKVALIGQSTTTSIQSGVQNGILFEIDGIINHYKKQYQNLKIILCGGDAIYLADNLKNPTFAQLNFMLFGLNEILLFNA